MGRIRPKRIHLGIPLISPHCQRVLAGLHAADTLRHARIDFFHTLRRPTTGAGSLVYAPPPSWEWSRSQAGEDICGPTDHFQRFWKGCGRKRVKLGLDIRPEMIFFHSFLNTVHSGCNPGSFVPSFTHSPQRPQVFLPHHFSPTTSTFLQANTQSSPLLRSQCSNHLNLPRLTKSATLWTLENRKPHNASQLRTSNG